MLLCFPFAVGGTRDDGGDDDDGDVECEADRLRAPLALTWVPRAHAGLLPSQLACYWGTDLQARGGR